jgi:hypothetical protein
MHLPSIFWRAVLKWPRLQRLEVLELPEFDARIVQIPKAGSGTIRMHVLRSLRELDGRELPKSDLWRYVRFVKPPRLTNLDPPRYTFGFVRSPYTRLVSCYRHKIELPRRQRHRVSRLFAVYGRAFSLQMDFPAFVRAVATVPDRRAEKHFRSQVAFLYDDGQLLVDFVGHLEQFEKDWAEVCRHTRLGPVSRAYNVTGGIDLADWYDAELLQLVNRRFENDFTAFGYEVIESI